MDPDEGTTVLFEILYGMDFQLFKAVTLEKKIRPMVLISDQGKIRQMFHEDLTNYNDGGVPVGRYSPLKDLRIDNFNDYSSPSTRILAATVTNVSQADGSMGSVSLIPAAGVGLKIVILDIFANAIVTTTPAAPAGGIITMSDLTGDTQIVVSGGGMVNYAGPKKQDTANTPIAISAGAGACSASSTFMFSVRYRIEV